MLDNDWLSIPSEKSGLSVYEEEEDFLILKLKLMNQAKFFLVLVAKLRADDHGLICWIRW